MKLFKIDFEEFLDDEITFDDYDISGTFSIETKALENINNVAPEGYYYKAHYKVLLKEFEDSVNQGGHIRMSIVEWKKNGNVYYCKTSVPYYFSIGDYVYFYDKSDKQKYIGKIESVLGLVEANITITLPKSIENYYVYRHNSEKPNIAYELEDGTGRYVWREIKKNINVLPGDETYNSFFANGCIYYHNNITFYLKRQDPFKTNGLNTGYNIDGITGASECTSKDITSAEYIEEGRGEIC